MLGLLLVHLGLGRREDFGAEVEDGERARNLHAFADLDDGQVPRHSQSACGLRGPSIVVFNKRLPSADQANKAKTTADLEQVKDVCLVGKGRSMRCGGVCSGDEGEEHDEAKEEEDEEDVDA